jgi:hypothetical protein
MKKVYLLTGWILLASFVFGMIQLMRLRFSAGDVYPYYSSFRADPLGTKALFESLELCCDFQVQRNHEPFTRVKDRFDSTVLVLGLSHQVLPAIPKTTAEEINYFVNNGGRLIITLHHQMGLAAALQQMEDSSNAEITDLSEFWGFRVFVEEQTRGGAYLERSYPRQELPRNISAHTPIYFQTIHPAWKVVYHRDQHPVLIERRLGRGSLAVSAESYFLSNEALAKERYPVLLSWLVGDPEVVIFDEYHHGIASEAGVMYLARKYDLEWLFGIFFLLGLLFIWKNATPLVPSEAEMLHAHQSGKESVAGLTNLLRRNIPDSRLLDVCFAEWQKSGQKISEQSRKWMEETIGAERRKPGRQKDPAAAYNTMSRALKQRR